MVVSAIAGIVFLSVMELTIPQYFFCLGVMNLVVALYVYNQLPEFVLRFAIWILSHTVYRVKHQGLEHIPAEGPAVIVCNHVSFVDPLIIAGAVRRPVRFVMDSRIYQTKGLHWFFKAAQTVPICPQHQDEETFNQAFVSIKQILDEGEVVCIFPEGKLTRDGAINPFKSGIERILEQSPVPVVPMALQGLWGSFFSHHGGKILSRTTKRFWSKIGLTASDALTGDKIDAKTLEQQVSKLRADNR